MPSSHRPRRPGGQNSGTPLIHLRGRAPGPLPPGPPVRPSKVHGRSNDLKATPGTYRRAARSTRFASARAPPTLDQRGARRSDVTPPDVSVVERRDGLRTALEIACPPMPVVRRCPSDGAPLRIRIDSRRSSPTSPALQRDGAANGLSSSRLYWSRAMREPDAPSLPRAIARYPTPYARAFRIAEPKRRRMDISCKFVVGAPSATTSLAKR